MDSTNVASIPLEHIHIGLGAKMAPFAGFNMPVRYSGDIDEHHAVRNSVGVFDVSHMGEFWVKGPEALNLVQWVTSNDASVLTPGKIQYSCLPNATGGIVDDLLVYCIADDEYLLVVNAGNIAKDWAWINSQNTFNCTIEDRSPNTCLFAVQGPLAAQAIQSLTEFDLSSLTYYTFAFCTFAGFENVLISSTGYTGAGGFEIYMPNNEAETIWHAIFKAGEKDSIKPIGLGARDTLRLEMGFCLYGNDIDDTTSPIEAGLGWITKFTKNFVNREAIEKHKTEGADRKLVGFVLSDKGIARAHYDICNAEGEVIGQVTSGTQSPTLVQSIGMGYVPTALSKSGSEIYINVRGKLLKAAVTKLPFIKK